MVHSTPTERAAGAPTVRSDTDTRSSGWRRWTDITRPTAYTVHVAQRGVLSSLSVPLPIQTDVIGALNCYSRIPSAFPAEATEVAEELAGHLAVAVSNAVAYTNASTLVEQMRTAMASRSVIDHAMGIVMAQNRCDAKAAFAVLTRGITEPQYQAARDRPQHRSFVSRSRRKNLSSRPAGASRGQVHDLVVRGVRDPSQELITVRAPG